MMTARVFASTLLLTLGAVAVGCAASTDEPPVDDGPSSGGSTPAVGGAGGVGGMGGDGGTGTGLCDTDCAAVQTPPCLVSVCNDGTYPGTVGECVITNAEDGTACDDGVFCTVDDTCQAGECTGGPPNDCGLTPGACEAVTCDEGSSSCDLAPANDGMPCTSTDLCLVNTTCQAGVCGSGTQKDCLFAPLPEPDECYQAVCNPNNGDCEPVPANDGAPCEDPMDLCSVGNTCSSGACTGGCPKDCSSLTQGCDLGVCDAATGMCMAQAVMNGQMCDDLDACTTGEICTSGTCGGGTAVTTCELAGDGCCPSNCTALDDLDCQCSATSVTTSFTNTTGWDGFMFDIVAKSKSIEILSFDANWDTGSKTVEIYYKSGTFNGFETNMGAWTFAGSATINPTMSGVGTPIPIPINVTIPPGQTYGFYIFNTAGGSTSNGINYVLSVPTGSVQTENTELQILGGKGQGANFTGSTFVDRGFSGTVHYEECGS